MNKSRLYPIYLFIFISFFTLFARYAYLQLIDHKILLRQSIDNYSSKVATLPVRGAILDTNGRILANNTINYVAAILPKNVKSANELIDRMSKYINITELDKKKFRAQLRNIKNYDWAIIKDDLSNAEIANLTAHQYQNPEINVFANTRRNYPFGELYAHSIGYVGRVSSNDQIKLRKEGLNNDYLKNDYLGKSGLEQYYENLLRGTMGKKLIKTDALGNEIALISNTSAKDGYSIKLTLDNELQTLAAKLLANKKGAIVAINPQTGGILSFVSKPTFDPNWFINGISIDDWDGLQDNIDKPLLNRASKSSYPPGSIIKPFLALGALHYNIRIENYTLYDPGYFIIPGSTHKFRDTHPHGLGIVNMFKAITYSSDTYFYKLALDMGIDRMDQVMHFFNLGDITGVDLPQESKGLRPTKEWKAKRFQSNPYQKKWLAADSVTVGIGQGFANFTPLQMAHATAILANNGLSYKPHFLKQVLDKDGKIISTYKAIPSQVNIKRENFTFIKRAMQNVITTGTASMLSNNLSYTMAGKTGTAQVVAMQKNTRQAKFSGKRFKDHSWFIAFAPVDKPKIAIAIIIENGGFGAKVAAPLAREIFDFYLLGKKDNPTIKENDEI